MTARHGGCLCGRIRYVYDPDGVLWAAHCHCESCRRAIGGPVATFMAVRRTAYRWLGPVPKSFASSPGVTRGFCPDCGTSMTYATETRPDETHLLAATLDDPSEAKPTRHDFWNERLSWPTIVDRLEKHDGD